MIIGIGTDMVDVRRIRSVIDRFGERFVTRTFTESEAAHARSRPVCELGFAKRFAAKEAVAKALGTGIRGFTFRDIEVVNDGLGKPLVHLHGGASDRLTAIIPEGHKGFVHLSLTDEDPHAMAFVVIEARPVTKI